MNHLQRVQNCTVYLVTRSVEKVESTVKNTELTLLFSNHVKSIHGSGVINAQ